jgi:hypothetical protein
MDKFFNDLRVKAITLAARQGINRAGKRWRSYSMAKIRQRIKVKLKDIKGTTKRKGRVTFDKATGMNLGTMTGVLTFSRRPLPMILFIKGQAKPIKQTRPNRRRRPRKFEVGVGRKVAKRGLFVEKAKRGPLRYQVFRRVDPSDKTKGFKTQKVSSLAALMRNNKRLLSRIENRGKRLVQIEYRRALDFQLKKLKV